MISTDLKKEGGTPANGHKTRNQNLRDLRSAREWRDAIDRTLENKKLTPKVRAEAEANLARAKTKIQELERLTA